MKRGLSGQALKLIAAAAMLIDHVGFVLMDDRYIMRLVGRVAFPVFAFMLVEGFCHTKSRGRYCLRLGLCALLSEPLFDLGLFGFLYPRHQNTLFTLLFGLLGLWGAERLSQREALKLLPLLGAFAAAELLHTDGGALGVLLMVLYWRWRGTRWGVPAAVAAFTAVEILSYAEYAAIFLPRVLLPLGCLAAVPLLMLYDGRRGGGGGWSKGFFYLFYPGHLALLWVLRSCM